MEKNTILLDVPKDSIDFQPPNDFVPEENKNADWFLRWARYYCTFYNPPAYNWDFGFGGLNTSTNSSRDISNWNFRLTDDMVNNFSYLLGQQPNINYAYLTMDATGSTFQSPWIKGRKAGMIVNFAHGDLVETLESIEFDAVSLSRDIITKKQQLFDQIELAHDMDEMLQPMQESGVSFEPYKKKLNSKEDILAEKLSYKDEMERDCIYIAEDLFVRNEMNTRYSQAYLNALCGFAAVYNYVENGKVKKKPIDCWNVIWDNRQNDPYGRYMRFWGFIEYKTPSQCISEVPGLAEIPTAVSELNAIADGSATNIPEYFNYYNQTGAGPNFQWWRPGQHEGSTLVSVVTLFWIAPRDLKFKKYVNDYGQDRIKSIKDQEKLDNETGQYLTMDIHKCQLVGNRWATNFGYAKNTVRDYKNKGNPIPNMSFFIPNMIMGQPVPVMSMIKRSQDELDRLGHKIREITGRDLGKIPVFNAAKLGDMGKSAIQFMDEIKNAGALVALTTGEFEQMVRDMKMVEVMDLTAISNLQSYLLLRQEEERQMEEIVGYSKIALGQQSGYVSQGVQTATINTSSNVMKNMVNGFREFMRRDMEYSVNMQRPLIGSGKEKDGELIIGKDGVRLMKSMGKERFSDLLLYLKIQTPIDKQDRKDLILMAQQWAANPTSGIRPEDVLMLMTEKSLSVMERKLRKSLADFKMEQTQQQNYNNMIQMVQAKAQAQQAQAMMQQQEASKQAISQGKNETKLASDMLSNSAEMAKLGHEVSAGAESAPTE